MGLVLRIVGFLLWVTFEVSAATLFFGTPLVGFWLASSLAAYLNGPPWLALGAGLTVFPVLPVAWELRAAWKLRGQRDVKRSTTLFERLGLRTFAVGMLFLGVLVGYWPRQSFVALSTRRASSARSSWRPSSIQSPRVESATKDWRGQ